MDAVARVRPTLEAGAREAEETATLPRASVDALYESGLFLLKLPQALGGAEKLSLAKVGRLPCRGSGDTLNKSLTASAINPSFLRRQERRVDG